MNRYSRDLTMISHAHIYVGRRDEAKIVSCSVDRERTQRSNKDREESSTSVLLYE